jgi:hypothetical protein
VEIRQVVPRDAIPSVDDPDVRGEYDGDPDDEVIVVEFERSTTDGQGAPARSGSGGGDAPAGGGDVLAGARAYPVRYLDYHEVVNDRLPDGRAVAVTWCPLCASAVVYDRRVGERTLTFGVSGKLADDDLVLYDRETDSEFKQSLGEAIAGPLAGTRLEALPATLVPYRTFRDRYPDGEVLAPPGGESEAAGESEAPAPIDYDHEPYRRYFETEGFGLDAHRGGDGREWTHDGDLDPKALVLGVEHGDEALGFVRERLLAAGGTATATVGDRAVLAVASEDGLFAYGAPDGPVGLVDGDLRVDGRRVDPATGRGEDGTRLERVPARRLFAFAWHDDHGDRFHDPESESGTPGSVNS